MATRNDHRSEILNSYKTVAYSAIFMLTCLLASMPTFALPVLSMPNLSATSGAMVVTDYDGDGIADDSDNCIETYNPNQSDLDSNNIGDACEQFSTPALFGSSGILYDVDFSTPPHVVGLPPTVGQGPAPRVLPTLNVFGEPLVVNAVGALDNQPLQFDHLTPDGRLLEQSLFGLGSSFGDGGFALQFPAYHIEMNILVEILPSGTEFTVFADGPKAHSVRFRPSGEIAAKVLGTGNYDVAIGSYTLGVPLFLEINVDLVAQTWSISIDGSPVFTGSYPSQLGNMRLMRLNLSPAGQVSLVAVDNIRIEATPDAGACCNMMTGMCSDAVASTACVGPFDRFGGSASSCATMDPPCSQAIPTTSEWGLLIFTLLLLVGSKINFSRRKPA